jgi:hypothetical protein
MKYFIHILEEQILYSTRAPNTLKSEGEVTSLSCADKREVGDNREAHFSQQLLMAEI